MKIITICNNNNNNKTEKIIHFINGRIKQLLYYKCKEFIVCKNILLKCNPMISIYPSPKTLVERFKVKKLI